jgi:hypothetical protein
MSERQPESEPATSEGLKELAYENRWYIKNRWTVAEQQANATRVADKLVAIVTGETVIPVTFAEPQPGPSELTPPVGFTPPEWLVKGVSFPIVGRRFDPRELIAYVKWVKQNET